MKRVKKKDLLSRVARLERQLPKVVKSPRANYLWQTKPAAETVGMVPNKFGEWWYRNREKLVALMAVFPGETAAELMAICAEGVAQLQEIDEKTRGRGQGRTR